MCKEKKPVKAQEKDTVYSWVVIFFALHFPQCPKGNGVSMEWEDEDQHHITDKKIHGLSELRELLRDGWTFMGIAEIYGDGAQVLSLQMRLNMYVCAWGLTAWTWFGCGKEGQRCYVNKNYTYICMYLI